MEPTLEEELFDWLRIPSVSTGPRRDVHALRRAAGWVCERIDAAGGDAALVETETDPLAVGELRAAHDGAPTVLAYGHYDVQDIGDPAAWESPPFEPEIRDGRIYARGAADDKGNFLPLLHVACALARAGELPVNVRFLVEGEEETGGTTAPRYIEADERGADCAIVFDSLMVDRSTPALTVGARGMVLARIEVETGERDLHSGLYGGAAMNAAAVITRMLAAVLPGPDGRVPEELRRGVVEPSEAERASWNELPRGEAVLEAAGARPLTPGAAAELYERTGADTSLDVNEIVVGEPRTIVPCSARATVSARLAPGQSSAEIAATLERLLRAAAPPEATVRLSIDQADPAIFDPSSPALVVASKALGQVCGRPPAIVRIGGTLPVLASFAKRGIPAIVTGFVLPEDRIHSPNESFRAEALALGERAAHALYGGLASLTHPKL